MLIWCIDGWYPLTFISEITWRHFYYYEPWPRTCISVSVVIKNMRRGGQKSSVMKVSPPFHPLRPLWQGTGVKTCTCESCHILVNLLTEFHPSTLKEEIDFVILFCFSTPWKCNILLHLRTELHLLFML